MPKEAVDIVDIPNYFNGFLICFDNNPTEIGSLDPDWRLPTDVNYMLMDEMQQYLIRFFVYCLGDCLVVDLVRDYKNRADWAILTRNPQTIQWKYW